MEIDAQFSKLKGKPIRLSVIQGNKEIASELYISDQTVSVHRKNIMRKLGVSSTASLIKMAFENNLIKFLLRVYYCGNQFVWQRKT